MDQDPNNPFADVDIDLEGDMSMENAFTDQDTLLSDSTNNNMSSSSSSSSSTSSTAGASTTASPAPSSGGACPCFQVAYYQPYFDVDTDMVQTRVLRSFTALRPSSRDFFELTKGNADLFGPFWCCCTLIFAIGVFANFSSYLSFVPTSSQPRWYYDFTLMTGAAAFVFGFGFGVPVAMWGVARSLSLPLSLIQATCLFGYSMGVYILATGLCMVPSDIVSWVSVAGAAVVSCSFVGLNMQTYFKDNGVRASSASSFLGAVAIAQVVFAGVLKVYFFSHISPIQSIPSITGNVTGI
jgi:protein YIPF1/2